MAATTIHIGTQAPEDRDTTLVCDVNGEPIGDGHEMEGARACLPSLESTHNGLTRTVFIRRTIEELLAGRQVYIADGGTLGKQQAAQRTALFFVVDPPFHKYDIPWMPAALDEIRTIELIGESGKMAAPTWDLPAGSPVVGGSCPAATAGQSVIPLDLRSRSAHAVGQPVKLQETICQLCVAGDAMVLVRGRGWVRIDELHGAGDFEVWSGKDWRVTHVVEQGVKEVVEVETSWGAVVRVTPDHKLLTAHDGMVPAEALTVGDVLVFEPGPTEHVEVKHPHVTRISRCSVAVPVYDLVNVGPERQFVANGISLSNCYAVGGNYASPHVQIGEMVRYWWCRQMLDGGTTESRQAWVETVVRAIEGTMFPEERPIDPRTGKPVLPMRIHSSGDFYSAAYAEAWVEVCNRLPEVMFWAPTRTWASPGWMRTWQRVVPLLQHGNLSLRPSAYHTGDPAPGEREHPWPGRARVFTSEGTTSVYAFDDANAGRPSLPQLVARGEKPSIDPRYDWPCGTYQILDDAHSCRNAVAPDGKVGCRACWIHPELRVNYTTH